MHRRIITVGLAIALAVSLGTLAIAWRAPGNNQGYAPIQPIAFSHKLHSGEMQIACVYCHLSAETSRYAGIPALSTCMNCHMNVTTSFAAQKLTNPPESSELRRLYDALALDKTLKPVAGRVPKPIRWERVHQLPDFVYFDHRAHITAAVTCQTCHGPIETMDRVRQFETLSMGWCVNCHRDVNLKGVSGKQVQAPIDCITCHY
jgi:Cytochrome c7 and related cytochrome c/Class III cytochrome C family